MSVLGLNYPLTTTLSLWASTLGAPVVLVCIGILIAFWNILTRSWRTATVWVLTVGASVVAVESIKAFVSRLRPEDALLVLTDPSFPSGHALMSAAFFTLLGYFGIQKIQSNTKKVLIIVLCILAPLLVGISRVVLNVHWVTDVLVGWVVGILIAAVAIILVRVIFLRLNSSQP